MFREIPYRDLLQEIERNPNLAELITQKREWGVRPRSLEDVEFEALKARMRDLNHVFYLETPSINFQYSVLEFGDESSELVRREDLFFARGIVGEDFGNVYKMIKKSKQGPKLIQGYQRSENSPSGKCGRQYLTDRLGVQTTFIPLVTSSQHNRNQRATNVFVSIDENSPSLRYNPSHR